MPTVTGDNFYIDKHTLQFRTGETGVASIVYDKTDESISIANAGTGQISIGDAGGDIYIGDGSTETDIIFEQNGAIRALTNKTLKLGQGDSDVKVEAQNFLVTGDAGFSGTVTINGNPVMTGANPYDEDTLQTVTDRGATTTNAITLQNNLTLSYNYPRINLTDTNNDSDYSIINNDGSFGIYDVTNTAYRLQILSGGNVGIGSATPAYKLDVAGDIATDRYIRHNGDTNTYFGFPSDDTIQFNTNSSERMRITSAGNVGIGTSSPNQKFVVTARSNFDSQNNFYGSWVDGNTAGDSFFAVGQWWNVGGRMQAGSNNMYIHTHNSSHDLVLQSGGGYVGIGTNSPSQKLEIIADATALADQPAEPLFVHNDGNSIDGRVFLSVKHDEISTAQALGAGLKMTAGAVTAGTASYFDSLIFLEGAAAGSDTIHSAPKAIKFYVDNHGTAAGDGNDYSQLGDLRLTIAEDGNIGIGDASPIGDLQIGTNVFSGANGVYADDRIGLSVNGGLKSMVYASTYNNATYPDYGMVFIHGPNTGDYNVWSISPDGPAKGSGLNFIYRKDATNIHTTTPKVVFDGNGNVGIGTNDPNVPLEIAMNSTELVNLGSSGPNATIQFGSSSSTTFGSIGARQTNTSQSALGFLAATPNSSTALYGDMFFSTRENDDSDFSTTAGKRAFSFVRYTNPLMTIMRDGKVGIGTTSPEDLLTVSAGAGSSTTDLVNVGGTGNGRMLVRHIEGKDFNSASLDTLYLNYDSNGAIIAAYGGGNVGIGTNNPDAKLHLHKNSAGSVSAISQSTLVVENNSANAISMLTPNNTTSYLVFGDPDDNQRGYLSYTHADDTMRFKVGGDERMFITGNGNISIGTTALAPHKLNVKGTIVHLNDSNIQVVGITNANGDGRFYANNAGGVTKALIDSNGYSYINGGNVGIGTTSPSVKLDVNGNIKASQVGVTNIVTNKIVKFGGTYLDDSIIYDDGTNVGIATNSPTSKLHVYGGDNTGLFGSIRNDFTNRMNIKVAMGSTTRYIGTVEQYGNGDSSGFTIRIYDGAEKVFRIVRVVVQNSGGTNSVSATVEGGGEDTDIHINLEYKNRDGDATKTDFFLVPTSKNFTQYVEIEGYILRDTGWNTTSLTSVSLDDDLALNILDSVNGSRVGVGTTDPSAKFHAEGSMIVKGDAGWAGTDNQDGAIFLNTAGRALLGAFSTSYARPLIRTSNNYIEHGSAGTSLINGFRFYAGSESSPIGTYDFYTSGSNSRLHIEKGGNIGIGTNSPSANLDIYNDSSWSELHLDGSNGGEIKLQKAGTTHLDIYASDVGSTASVIKAQSHLQLASNNSTAANSSIYLKSNGNVGIGTDSPSGTLHVSNTGSEYTDKFIVDGSHGRLFNVSDETTGIIFSVNDAAGLPVLEVDSTSAYDKVSIGEFGTNALVVSGSGVSIGVTGSREEVLEVYPDKDESAILGKAHVGYVGFSNFAGFSHVDRNSTTTYALLQSEAGSTYLNKAAGQQIYFRNGNSNVGGFNNYDDFYVGASSTDNIFYVDRSTDRVGIGTTSPSQELDVDGVIKQKVYTVSTLPTAGGSTMGARAFVSDSYYAFSSSYLGSQVAGGGSNFSPVYSDGNYWYMG